MEHCTIKVKPPYWHITADEGYHLSDATEHSFKEIKILPSDITQWKVIKV